MLLRFLGTHNVESGNTRLPCILVDDTLALDAGSLTSELSLEAQRNISSILLTHGHYDHVRAVPAFAFNNYAKLTKVYGTRQTLDILSSHLVDGTIYPKFTERIGPHQKPALELLELTAFQSATIEAKTVLPLPVNHPLGAVGYAISTNEGRTLFYSGDTGPGLATVWQTISPDLVITDGTFPNRLRDMASESGHLCPDMLRDELVEFRRVKGYLPEVILVHVTPQFEKEIGEELKKTAHSSGASIRIAHEGAVVTL